MEQLLTEVWSGPGSILLNPEFPAAPVPEQYKGITDSILVVWSFLPLLVSVSAFPLLVCWMLPCSLSWLFSSLLPSFHFSSFLTPTSFHVPYPFTPQGLIANKGGAVLRQVGKAGPSSPDAAWRILYKVSRMKKKEGAQIAVYHRAPCPALLSYQMPYHAWGTKRPFNPCLPCCPLPPTCSLSGRR